MGVYDYKGNPLDATTAPRYLGAGEHVPINSRPALELADFPLVHAFTPFATDYSCGSSTPRVLDIGSEAFLNTFYNPYLGWHGNFCVTKRVVGRDESNTYDVWAYDFRPLNPKRKVLLSSGMHTYELPASFGLARWVKELMESNDPAFVYLRENVAFSIIPIVNPWGYNQNPKTYGNVNGVNPNRNYDDWTGIWSSFPTYTPSQNEWNVKGDAPFSEAETQNLISWVKANLDASFYIDCHTGLNCARGDIWIYYASEHPFLPKINAAISALQAHYIADYGKSSSTVTRTVDDETFVNGKYYQRVLGMPMMTLEQSHGTNNMAWDSRVNNNPISIKEYATQVHAFVMAQLQG